MKIERSKVKKGTSEVPEDCRKIINFLKLCSEEELLEELKQINVWYYGKCELYHWIDVIDRFDSILADVARPVEGKKWIFEFDVLVERENGVMRRNLVFHVLKFTALLIEHSYARHLYNSVEHLITLLDCIDGNVILSVLNLIFVFSKRSNYLSRLPNDKKKLLQEKLFDLAQTWGGLEAGCALEQCCSEDMPIGAGNVYYEYYISDETSSNKKLHSKTASNRYCIDLKNIHQMAPNAGLIMENIIKSKKLPDDIQVSFYHRLRLAHAMASYEQRLQYVQARLQALSILVYSNATTHVNVLVYDGLIEEIVNTLKINDNVFKLAEVKASCLKTLTAIIHLDRNPRLQSIIDCTEATSYHGFLPSLVRKCILHMTDSELDSFPQHLATSLFSFLYHLASYESGCEALVASGLIESLLKVVLWPGQDDHITFVTRAVRVIDLITNLDMGAFQTHNGLSALIGRLEREVKLCSEFHGPPLSSELPTPVTDDDSPEETPSTVTYKDNNDVEMKEAGSSKEKCVPKQCLPQRAALLKSILNFLKKAIPDPAFADNTRSLMDENLQYSLRLIISNAEYYGALLFLLATDVITVFIFHEPSLLSTLQDSGLTWVVLKALIIKDVPATRENLASLPNTLSALCLNTRGLEAFISCKPFERLFDILINPEYLPAMKRRRSSDPQGDTAMHLGSAMDELMRHQPTLKTDATKAIIKLLKKLGAMGRDKSIISFHPTDKMKPSKKSDGTFNTTSAATAANVNSKEPLTDDEMEEEYRSVLIRKSDSKQNVTDAQDNTITSKVTDKRKYVPVVDYLLNVTKFLDNILSNNGTDDHCVEFVLLGGLEPLYNLLNMSNFPLEFPLMPACQSISQVCKSIAMLTQDNKVFKEGLTQLDATVDRLEALYAAANTNGSVLLHELASTENPIDALYNSEFTPLVHTMSAAHAYINIFVFICRGAQSDIRNMSISQWGSDLGQSVLEKLSNLYTKLVWESSSLLTLCTPSADEDLSFAQADMNKLLASNNAKEDGNGRKSNQLSLLKWLLTSSSHLGRALAELFGLLVLQSVGTQNPRVRRAPHNLNQVRPTLPARKTATMLTKLLVQGLSWECPTDIVVPRLRLTFYICSVGFSSPMLFDNSKNPYHLMLQQFENAGGLEALFKRFNWVLDEYINNKSVEEIKTAVGISDFLEGWLDLINHMVNTKLTFESTYSLPNSSVASELSPFDVTQFIARIHMYAFESVMLLWKHDIIMNADNHNIAERILSILCLIIKGEKQLKEKFILQNKTKEKSSSEKPSPSKFLSAIQKTPAPTTFRVYQQEEINEAYLQQFVDMGFSSEHARDALVHTHNNFEVATEYLLTTPYPSTTTATTHSSNSSADTTASTISAATNTAATATSTSTQSTTAVVSIEEASTVTVSPSSTTTSTNMDVDLSEEDLMFQAIALSLGQPSAENSAKKSKSATKQEKIAEENPPQETLPEEGSIPDITSQDLDKFTATIDQYTNEILDGCLLLLDSVPSTVHTVCDLLLAVSHRNGLAWRNSTLEQLVEQIQRSINGMLIKVKGESNVEKSLKVLCESDEANQLSVRLHLYLLLFQDIENTCAYILQESNCPKLMVDLLAEITGVLKQVKAGESELQTPNVTAPLILIFDHYEKAALFYKRKKDQVCSHTWKWFDDRSGRWCNYSVSNNTSIDTAYHAGENTVKFAAGRRRYMVFFKSLVQINEDTGNRRPIMLDVLQGKTTALTNDASASLKYTKGNVESAKESELRKNSGEKSASSKSMKRKFESGEKQKMDVDFKQDQDNSFSKINGLSNDIVEQILCHSTDLLGIPVNGTSLNALFRILLRVTRDFQMACFFAQRNGVEYLLNLKDCSSFNGALPLVTLLLRHIVEDNETMKHAVERAVSIASNNGIPNMLCGVGQNSLGAKELHYLLRSLGSIACRNSNLYNETTLKMLRITLPNSRRGQVDETIPPNSSQIVKVPQEFKTIGLNGSIKAHPTMENFVHLLLQTLVERHFQEIEDSQNNTSTPSSDKKLEKGEKKKGGSSKQLYTPQSTLVRRLTGEHIDEEDMVNASLPTSSTIEAKPSTSSTDTTPKADKPFISEAVIIRLLTELAKSYAAVAQLIVNYSYHGNEGTSSVEGPILAFIFDYLLPHTLKDVSVANKEPQKESKPSTISTLSRSFLSVLGAYWHNPEVQSIFVIELKGALSRALHLPECKSKHIHLQAIFNLITSMIESAAPISFTSSPPLQNSSFIKMLIKRGLIADLARSTHSLDLSSHDLVNTVNVMLKPLEKLSNLANSQSLQKPGTAAGKDNDKSELSANTINTPEMGGVTTEDDLGDNMDENNHQSNQNDVDDATEIRNLDDIVEVMLADTNDGEDIYAETMMTSRGSNNGGIAERIFIESNVNPSNSSESENSSVSDHHSNHNGNDPLANELCNCEDDHDDDELDMNDGEQNNADEEHNGGDNLTNQDVVYSLTANEDLDEDNIDSEAFRSFMETGGEDQQEEEQDDDDVIENDDDEDSDDDDDDDDVNDDEDDDEGSEMDADDTMATAETIIIGEHDEEDDATDDMGDPFAELDGNNDTLEEVLFPRRPFAVRIPQVANDNNNSSPTIQTISTILGHPLLMRNNEQPSRLPTNQRAARTRASRAERGFIRAQGNTVHIHGNANTFARVLNGDTIQAPFSDFIQNDDMFFDIFGDSTDSQSGLLNSIPSALSRWSFESRLLDGSSVHDCVNALKPAIVAHLEKLQLEELKEKLVDEKRKKEELEKKKQVDKEKAKSSATTSSSTSLAAGTSTSTTSASTTNTSISRDNALNSTSTLATYMTTAISDELENMLTEVDAMETSPSRQQVLQDNLPAVNFDQPEESAVSSALPDVTTLTPATFPIPSTLNNRSNTTTVETTLWTPASVSSSSQPLADSLSRYITPFNPLPNVAPNAPQRDVPQLSHPSSTAISSHETPVAGFSSEQLRNQASEIATLLGVANSANRTSSVMQTPIDLPRLNQFRNNMAALTGDLGLTPNTTRIDTPNMSARNLPSVAQILATPSDIPSLQQLRNNSLFSQNSTPRVPYSLPSLLRNIATPNVPSPLTRSGVSNIDMDPTSTASGESALAADLAAAIMSQLVTSSPTPAMNISTAAVDVSSGLTTASNIAITCARGSDMMQRSSTLTSVMSTLSATNTSGSLLGSTALASSGIEAAGSSSSVMRAAEQIQRELEGLGIPEGVDPSFLAALPDNIREEVLREQFGIRIQQSAASSSNLPTQVVEGTASEASDEPQEVSPEFLAALPPEVQQEVLEQQRMEQARYVAAQQRPEQPVDPAEFVRNLNPSLRRQVLADMDDTVLAVLPPELTNEAQGLRREVELRQLQRNAEREFSRTANANFSQIFRQTDFRNRLQGGGFQLARIYPRGQMNSWKVTDGNSSLGMSNKKIGRQLLDPEGLTSLLVLLFLNDSTLNASRLHRILRNLSYHNPTKQWIIFALISILRRSSSNQQESNISQHINNETTPQRTLCEEVQPDTSSEQEQQSNTCWLSRTLNLAFGGCVNIFQIQKVGRKPSDSFVSVHQQACLDVCKQTLEALSFLAKNFPSSFAPIMEDETKSEEMAGPSNYDNSEDDPQSEFWDILVHLNSLSRAIGGYKGKSLAKALHEFPKIKSSSVFVTSPLGQILSMLSHPVVKQSSMLTDKLLRLLAVISMSLPERPKHLQAQTVEVIHESSPDALPPDNDVILPNLSHPIHTVTFADTDDVRSERRSSVIDGGDALDTSATDGGERGTACSETNSIASSLYVEAPEITTQEQMLLPTEMRHLRHVTAGSVLSGLSGGTVNQSDISGSTTENIGVDHRNIDSMDVDHQSRGTSDTSSTDHRSSPTLSLVPLSPEKEPSILIGQLRMAVNVLTSGTCSDEGLEDATTLLLQLSRTEPMTRDSILDLLLEGAQDTANLLRDEIRQLLEELKEYNSTHAAERTTENGKVSKQVSAMVINPASTRSQPWRGRGGARNVNSIRRAFFGGGAGGQGGSNLRRNVPKPVIFDLHLPTMTALTTKRSSQSLMLRVLKVVLQLREAARKSAKKPATSARLPGQPRTRGMQLIQRLHNSGGSLREVVAALEADMEAMYEMIDRFGSSNGEIDANNAESIETPPVTSSSASNVRSDTQTISQEPTTSTAGQQANASSETQATTTVTTDTVTESTRKDEPSVVIPYFPKISSQLNLDDLWDVLGKALTELAETSDTNAVLVLQPAVEAFFLVHGSEKDDDKLKDKNVSNDAIASSSSIDIAPASPNPPSPGTILSPSFTRLNSQSSFILSLPPDTQKFLRFAETHRTVLNQILRQSTNPLVEGPFAVLVNHTRLLDFDVKRRYFRQELEKQDKGHRREDMSVHIRREHVFEDSYRELHRRTAEEIKNRLYIVFDGEEGQDAGGLLREWYGIMAREMFNPNYALFTISQGEKSTYLPNRNSHCNPNHLSYFKFAGRIVAKAIYDNKLIDSYFTRSFYKHILGKSVHYTDMEAEDYSFYQGLVYLLEHDIDDLGYDLTFTAEVQVFGSNEVHDLKPNGRNITVTEETKREYVKFVCQEKMTGSIRSQIDSFLEGFYEIIPMRLISIFDEQELELLIAGLPTIDIEDLRANTEYHKYTENSLQTQWLWRALRSFEQADRAKFLQFVTGTSRVPLQGFSTLEGMNGTQKFQIHRDDRSTERLPCAHTCFNQLDLPAYETYDKLHSQLLKAIQECPEGFGLA